MEKEEFEKLHDDLETLYMELQFLKDTESNNIQAETIIRKMEIIIEKVRENIRDHLDSYIILQASFKEMQQFTNSHYTIPKRYVPLPEYRLEYQLDNVEDLEDLIGTMGAHSKFNSRYHEGVGRISTQFVIKKDVERNTVIFTENICQAKQYLLKGGYLGYLNDLKRLSLKEINFIYKPSTLLSECRNLLFSVLSKSREYETQEIINDLPTNNISARLSR